MSTTDIKTSNTNLFVEKWVSVGIWALIIFVYLPVPVFLRTILVIPLLFLSLYDMNEVTRGFALLSFTAPALGTLFYVLHIPITAYFICLVMGIYFLRREFYFTRDDIGVLNKYLFLIIVFIVFFLLGPQHPYSISKIINIIIIGLISLVYWRAFIQSPYIERIKLSKYLCVIGLFYLAIAFDFFHFPQPSNLLDFNFFRSSFVLLKKETAMPFSYHSIGIPAMMGVALLFSTKDLKDVVSKQNLSLFISLLIVLLLAQARQAIFGSVIIVIIRVLIDSTIQLQRKINYILFAIIVSISIISFTKSDAVNSSMEAATFSKSLNRDYDDAYKIIKNDFALGKGLGGFSTNGKRAYPHNLFLELLCETGFVGTIMILYIVFLPLILNVRRVSLMSNAKFYVLPLICAVFIKSMMSSDLTESVELLTAVFFLVEYKDSYF